MSELKYPSIVFSERVLSSPTPQQRWRNRIGVASTFSKGSELPTNIDSMQEFSALYGLDNSPGSIFVQQAVQNGQSSFTIARASASANASTAKIEDSTGNPSFAPTVGYRVEGNSFLPSSYRAIGHEFEIDYLGEVIEFNSTYSPVRSRKSRLLHPTFRGVGRFSYHITEAVQGGGQLIPGQVPVIVDGVAVGEDLSIELRFLRSNIPGYQIATISKSELDLPKLLPLISPGYAFKKDNDSILIASKPFELSNTHHGVLVKCNLLHPMSVTGRLHQSVNEGETLISVDIRTDISTWLGSTTNKLAKYDLLINGVVYKQTGDDLTFNDGLLTTVIEKPGILHSLPKDAEVTLIPYLVSTNTIEGSNNEEPINEILISGNFGVGGSEGLVPGEDKLLINNRVYGIESITVGDDNTDQVGTWLVRIDGSIDFNDVPQNSVVTVFREEDQFDGVRIAFPEKAQYVIGYTFDTPSDLVGASLADDYLSMQEVYSDGYGEYVIDSYFLLTEDDGGYFRPFHYYTRPAVQAGPIILSSNWIGIDLLWGEQGEKVLPLSKMGYFVVPFAKETLLVGGKTVDSEDAYQAGQLYYDIYQDIQTAFENNSTFSDLIDEIVVKDLISTVSISFRCSSSGESSNRLLLIVTTYSSDPSKVKVSTLEFSGGYNGSRAARRNLYSNDGTHLWTLETLSPGSHGNQVLCSISRQKINKVSSSFLLEITDTNRSSLTSSMSRNIIVESNNIDIRTGRSLAFPSTSDIQLYFEPARRGAAANKFFTLNERVLKFTPTRLAPPLGNLSSEFQKGLTAITAANLNVLQRFSLQGGTDGTASSQPAGLVNGLIKAIHELEAFNIAALALPGINYGDPTYQKVFDTAIETVNRATVESGLRVAIFELPALITPERAQLLADELNNERVVLVAGRQTFTSGNGVIASGVGSSGSYAGFVYAREPHISPAAVVGRGLVQGASSVDTRVTPSYLNGMTIAGVEVMLFDQNMNGFRFLHGLTTTKSRTYRRYFSIMRVIDQIKSDLYLNLQWVRSRPNDSGLRDEVAASCDAYLFSKYRDGWLTRIGSTICSDTNNSIRDQQEGRLNVQIIFTPTFPADKILVDTVVDLTETLTLQTGV
jgi:hypothetical protein